MPEQFAIHLRPAALEDATTVAALAIQVFLGTYATEGVRPDLAAEALAEYSTEAFASRLLQSGRRFILAEQCAGRADFLKSRWHRWLRQPERWWEQNWCARMSNRDFSAEGLDNGCSGTPRAFALLRP